jgi:hypothetical protein
MGYPDPEGLAEPARGATLKPEDRRRENRRRGWAVVLIVVLVVGAAAGIGIFASHVYKNPYQDGFNYGASWAGLNGPHKGFPGCSKYDMKHYARDLNDPYGAWHLGCIEGSNDYFQNSGITGGSGNTGSLGNTGNSG